MDKVFKHPFRAYYLLTYLTFLVLFGLTGALVFSKAPVGLQTIMKNVCAWSSTFVLLAFYRKLRQGDSLGNLLKRQFPKVGAWDFLLPLLIQVAIAAAAVLILLALDGKPLGSLRFLSPSAILPLILVNLTSGPMGEELGWRGYALTELMKRRSLFASSAAIGLLWGLWHLPLWFVSGYSGMGLLFYAFSFLLGIVSFSFFISYFYLKRGNILVAVWIHFLFNILMQVVILEDPRFIFIIALLYAALALVLVLWKRSLFFSAPRPET